MCTKEFPLEIILTQECVNNYSIAQRKNNLRKINYISVDNNNKESE